MKDCIAVWRGLLSPWCAANGGEAARRAETAAAIRNKLIAEKARNARAATANAEFHTEQFAEVPLMKDIVALIRYLYWCKTFNYISSSTCISGFDFFLLNLQKTWEKYRLYSDISFFSL